VGNGVTQLAKIILVLVLLCLFSCGSNISPIDVDIDTIGNLPVTDYTPEHNFPVSFVWHISTKDKTRLLFQLDSDWDAFFRCQSNADINKIQDCHIIIVPDVFQCPGFPYCYGIFVTSGDVCDYIVLDQSLVADADEWFDVIFNDPETPMDLSDKSPCTKGV